MPPAARVTDMHTCPMSDGPKPHVGGPIMPPGCPTVLIGMMPAARIGDMVTCVGPPDTIAKGSATVMIGNMPAARLGDQTAHGGVITLGCPTVMIGDSGGSGGGGAASGGGSSSSGSGGTSSAEAEPTYADTDPTPREPGDPEQQVGTGTHWLELEMVDEADQPIVGERYLVVLPDRKEVSGSLDAKGQARLKGIKDPGTCQIKFPSLDIDAWERWSPASAKRPAPAGAESPPPSADEEEGPVPAGADRPGHGSWRKALQGECISSIAKDTGHFWDVIWNHRENAELKRRRGNPNVILAKDAVFVPTMRPKTESGATDQRHKYRRRGEPATFRIRIYIEDKPRDNEPFKVDVDGKPFFSGTTDDSGLVEFPIPGNVRNGILVLGEGEDEQTFKLDFGSLDPISEISGLQQRLHNLGYPCGPSDGVLGERTMEAIKCFERDNGLEETGKLDEVTRNKIADTYGA